MTDKELLYFKTIADERNITTAARKLFVTQPALSRCIKSLEDTIGTPLFIRTPKGLSLTYAGECYYAMAVDVLGIYNDYQQKIVDISQMRRGKIRIGLTPYIEAMLLPHILPKFSAKYPQVEIHLEEKNSDELETDATLHKIDFAVIHTLSSLDPASNEQVEYKILNKDYFCVITSKDNRFSSQAVRVSGNPHPVLDIKYLEQEPFVLENKKHKMRLAADEIFKRANISPRILLETDIFETAQRLAETGYCITIISERWMKEFLRSDLCAIYSLPKKYKPYWNLTVIRPAGGYMPVASQEFLNMIIEHEASLLTS